MLKVNLVAFRGGFQAWLQSRNLKAIARYKSFGRNLFTDIILRTPQYTGGTAANWKFGVGAISGEGATYLPIPDMPYVRADSGYGNVAARALAYAEVREGVEKIKSLSQAIFISNPTEFQGGSGGEDRLDKPANASSNFVAKAAEHGGNQWLRAENTPGDSVREAVSYAKTFNWYQGGGLFHEF